MEPHKQIPPPAPLVTFTVPILLEIMLFNILRQSKIEVFNYNLENNNELDEYFVKEYINDYSIDNKN